MDQRKAPRKAICYRLQKITNENIITNSPVARGVEYDNFRGKFEPI